MPAHTCQPSVGLTPHCHQQGTQEESVEEGREERRSTLNLQSYPTQAPGACVPPSPHILSCLWNKEVLGGREEGCGLS